MHSISAQNTSTSVDYFETHQESPEASISLDNSKAMWEYKNRAILDGIPVEDQAQHLFVDSVQEVRDATQTSFNIKVWSGYLSPKDEDKNDIDAYSKIMQDVAQNKCVILQQEKHFCPDLGKIMVLLIYAFVYKKLHPRYEHLKQDNDI